MIQDTHAVDPFQLLSTKIRSITAIALAEYHMRSKVLNIPSIDEGIQPYVTILSHSSSGGLALWDLRMSRRKISVLKGSSGSIRSLHLTPSG